MELFKKIWKDPVWSKVISVGILALISYIGAILLPVVKEFYLRPIPLWIVCIIVFATYIITKMSVHYSKQERNERKENARLLKASQKAWQRNKDEIWSAFVGLDESDIQTLLKLYNTEVVDPDNEHVRMTNHSEFNIYNRIIEKTNIPVISSNPYRQAYRPCITFERIGDKIHYTFDQYFFSLLMYYASTGQKSKL